MFNVTSGWLMTEISASPFMIAMVQVATSAPLFLFSLPAGALGDIFDRRKLLMLSQIALALLLFVFTWLLWIGKPQAESLLFFTFMIGVGTAFAMPAWQAIVPRLVPKKDLSSAIALNGVSINLARAIGPALGGIILTSVGAVATVAFDAISYLFIVAALVWWRVSHHLQEDLPREHLVGAMQAGLRFAWFSRPLKYTILRAVAFFFFAVAYWALLPLVAKEGMNGSASFYGMLLTALGCGAIGSALLLPLSNRYLNANQTVACGTMLTAISLLLFAYGKQEWIGIIAGLIAGIAWILVMAALTLSAQLALPEWVRARGLALFQMMFFGAMTCGALVWGELASMLGLSVSLTIAAIASLVVMLLTWSFHLNLGENHDHTPSNHWTESIWELPIAHDQGPVLVTLEYIIADNDREDFIRLIKHLGLSRRRDGAIQWGYFEDTDQKGHFIEAFLVDSWISHLRQHRRVSKTDKVIQDKINALHQGENPPRVVHAVTPK
jgi:MFS family permease